mmetsp:Transcript_12507/g.31536  ORF Transcript_12507/g.31536 Transcript_12507/m.31536 type:complete len:254 (+) Transcript_12507:550-1311(+)
MREMAWAMSGSICSLPARDAESSSLRSFMESLPALACCAPFSSGSGSGCWLGARAPASGSASPAAAGSFSACWQSGSASLQSPLANEDLLLWRRDANHVRRLPFFALNIDGEDPPVSDAVLAASFDSGSMYLSLLDRPGARLPRDSERRSDARGLCLTEALGVADGSENDVTCPAEHSLGPECAAKADISLSMRLAQAARQLSYLFSPPRKSGITEGSITCCRIGSAAGPEPSTCIFAAVLASMTDDTNFQIV